MCKLSRRIVKSIASMPTRLLHHNGDTSRGDRDAVEPAPAPRRSRESVGSPAVPSPGSSASVRGTAYSTVRNAAAPGRSPSHSQLPCDTQGRTDVEQHVPEEVGNSTVPTSNDRESVRSRKGKGSKTGDEPRPLEEQDQRQYDYDGDHTDGRRDTLRGLRYPSLKENHDVRLSQPVHAKGVEPSVPASTSSQGHDEAQSQELSTVQHERRTVLEQKKALADAYVTLQHRYEERSKKLAVARHERQLALEQRRQIDGAYTALKLQYEEQRKELDALRQEHQSALEQKQKAEEDLAAIKEKYESHKNEYSALRTKYHSLKATLEQRTSELQGVQKFLTTADTFSGTEVVNMLRKLNEEVQQSTIYMAEWAVENFAFETPPPIAEDIEQTRASESLGMRLMQLLATRTHKDNPILVEMAFRAYLMYALYWVASPWSMGQEEQSHNVYIDAIYQRMREKEGQAISGNWRALTRAYTLPACISDPEVAHAIDTSIVSSFSDILSAAGCTAPKTDVTSTLWAKFADQVHYFVSLAGQVNKVIGVGAISEDFEVLVVWPDTAFDDQQMEDSYDSGERVQGGDGHQEGVLCATDLGLMQRIKVGAGEDGQPSELIVMKPKVALTSVLAIIDG